MDSAQVLSPPSLVEKHRQAARDLAIDTACNRGAGFINHHCLKQTISKTRPICDKLRKSANCQGGTQKNVK
jgi:hypothetical protein